MNNFLILLLLAFCGSMAGLVGGIVLLLKKDWGAKLASYSIPFAAGVLLSVSILHLIPEANHSYGESAFLVVLLSFLGSFLFEQYFAHLHHHEEKKGTLTNSSVPLIIFGDTIHNFIDGVTIAAALSTSLSFGIIVALATFLHETPHEIGDFGVMISKGWSRKKTMIANTLSAMATFPGAIIAYYFLADSHDKIGFLLAISAGVFLYLGASDFLPEIEECGQRREMKKKISLVFLGVAVMYILSLITPEH